MVKKILIIGLPGSGKTTLAKILKKDLDADWINADKIRKRFNDWDFSKKGVLRQAERMGSIAAKSKKKFLIADFVCPYEKGRKIFNPNYSIWMDTIKKGRLSTFDKTFEKPKKFDYVVKEKNNFNLHSIKIQSQVKKFKWNNKNPTILFIGRWQPWHEGHQRLFEKAIQKTGQVKIYVKDVNGLGDNPYSIYEIKKRITTKLKHFKGRYKIELAPNITEINYGRTVGYKIKKIKLEKEIESISATKIRAKLRKVGKLK